MKKFKVAIIPAGDGPVSLQTIEGEDGVSFETIYPLINADMIEILEGKWNDVKQNIIFDCDLYCDEEGRLTGKQYNWRASQLRYNKLKPDEDNLLPGTVNDYWVQRRKQREATRRKRTSKKNTLTLFK